MRIVNKSRVTSVTTPNVIGRLRGERDDAIVVSAHADHLGIGTPVSGDAIYNGAIDNASGVATLIEVARAFAEKGSKPKPTILFVAFAAEEPGSLGSQYFVANPPARVIANVNIDGGALWPYDALILRGPGHEMFTRAVEDTGLKVAGDPFPERVTGSDQYSFITAGIPAVLISTVRSGEARAKALEWVRNRYHQPSDDMSQPLDFDAASRFTNDVFRFVQNLAE